MLRDPGAEYRLADHGRAYSPRSGGRGGPDCRRALRGDRRGWGGEGMRAAEPEVLRAIQQDPSSYYVNVHNEPFPDGAVRGQLC
jgi:hypothetical protein